MSKQLRDAIDVYRHAYAERMADWKTNEQQLANAAAVIEADRQEVREQTVTKIIALAAEWMGDIEFAQFKHRVEAEEWK